MSKRQPFFSLLSCGIASVLILCFIAALIIIGGRMFSPGPLTGIHPQNNPSQGFASHAEFENQCNRCHAPLLGPTANRCLTCHTTVANQVNSQNGLHGGLEKVTKCTVCHSDHLGRTVRITQIDTRNFPHQAATGFTLALHQTNYDEQFIACIACHNDNGYQFDSVICAECHAQGQPAFMNDHLASFGDDCLACHDGREVTESFNHEDFFLLDGAHATTACTNCHQRHEFKGTPHDCVNCHAANDIHNGAFGSQCGTCHKPTTWSQTILGEHIFPITHRNEGRLIECQVCHNPNFSTYTCFGCHEHNPAEIEQKHLEEGIRSFQNCVNCHPTGREHEGEDGD